MGWMADKKDETDAMMRAVLEPIVPAGDTLLGAVFAHHPKRFSATLYVLGVTDRHLVMQPVDRRMAPDGAVIVLRPDEIEVGNVFSEGAGLAGLLSDRDQEIRFTARGEKYKLLALGGNWLENAFASSGQVSGLETLVAFLRSARSAR